MKKRILFVGLTASLALAINGQDSKVSTSSEAKSTATITQDSLGLASTSQTSVTATLQKSINAEKAKVGDQVVLKTTKAVKQNGQVVIESGSKLVGTVTEVQRKTKENAVSKVGIVFDTLNQGGRSIPINVSIIAISNSAAGITADNDLFATTSASSTSSSRSSASAGSGGLLGGVGNTVGGIVNPVGSVVGSTVGEVTNTTGSTLGSVGNTVRGLQITNATSASANGGSMLSLSGGNIKLEKGASFQLAVSSSSDTSMARPTDEK